MPYSTKSELPDNVKESLSDKQQERFVRAFNSIWQQLSDMSGDDRESEAIKRAMGVVQSEDMAENDRFYIHGHAFSEQLTLPSGRTVPVNDKTVRTLVRGHKQLSQKGYYPPVLREHKSDGKGKTPRAKRDGFVYGMNFDVVDSRSKRAESLRESSIPTPDRDGVWYGLEVPAPMTKAHEEGFISNWSPSFYVNYDPPHAEMSERVELAPRHVAFVSIPHQKNTESSSPYYDLGEDLLELGVASEMSETQQEFMSKQPEQEQTMDEDEIKKLIEENVSGEVEELREQIKNLNEGMQAMLEEDGEGDEPSDEVEEMREQIEDLREENQRMERERIKDQIEAAGIDTDEEDVDELVELSESDPTAYTKRLAKAMRQGGDTSSPDKERGGTGPSPEAPKDDFEQMEQRAEELCEKHGWEPGSPKLFDTLEDEGFDVNQ